MSAIKLSTVIHLSPVKRLAQSAQKLEHLTPAQRERMMYWVGGLAPLATNITTPFFTRLRFQQSALPPDEQHKNVVQESARQMVSALTHIITYFGASVLVGGRSQAANKNLIMFLTGTAASFLGYAVFRPLISAELILRWLYPTAAKAAPPSDAPASNPKAKSPVRGKAFGGFEASPARMPARLA